MSTPRLHHLALGAHDVERVARFYRDALGLPEVARHFDSDGSLRSVWLALDRSLLMVEHSNEAAHWVEGIGRGPFLVAVSIAEHERAAREQQLERHGAPIESRTEFTSYARDPEGNRVAISHFELDFDPDACEA